MSLRTLTTFYPLTLKLGSATSHMPVCSFCFTIILGNCVPWVFRGGSRIKDFDTWLHTNFCFCLYPHCGTEIWKQACFFSSHLSVWYHFPGRGVNYLHGWGAEVSCKHMVYVLRITTDSESAVVQGVLYPVEVSSHTRVDFRKLAAAITEGHKANNVKPASVDVEEVQRPSAITSTGAPTGTTCTHLRVS